MRTLTDHEVAVVTASLQGHRLDTMSQDSGLQCECGSDSRFTQLRGAHEDPPWRTIEQHRAQVIARALATTPQPSTPEPETCTDPAERDLREFFADKLFEWLATFHVSDAAPRSRQIANSFIHDGWVLSTRPDLSPRLPNAAADLAEAVRAVLPACYTFRHTADADLTCRDITDARWSPQMWCAPCRIRSIIDPYLDLDSDQENA